MSNTSLYEIITTLILAALLFFPVSKIIWTMSVRRLQRKTGRQLNQQEIEGQMARARFITVFVVLLFSYLFNSALLGKLSG
ncbi:MAG: hypothetical protein GWN13_28855 [Phycisphaerae bacterium]|nr:hypothetical protein [Phycisphaerae bacterium]